MAAQVKIDVLASPAYRAVLTEMHARRRWGKHGASHAGEVVAFADQIGAGSILDYGCGRGTLRLALPSRFRFAEYDPGVPAFASLPAPADLVVATDVLEHVEPARLAGVLAHLRALARRGAFLVIAMSAARDVLPDGRNAHLIVQPASFWLQALGGAGFKIERSERRKGLYLWAR